MTTPDPLTSMTPEELIAVVTAGLDADEQAARACGGVLWVDPIPRSVHVDPKAIADNKLALGHLGHVATVVHDPDRQHIARHDPSRVLADVESKREIVELAERLFSMDHDHDQDERGVEFGHPIARRRMRDVLAALARPYLDREAS